MKPLKLKLKNFILSTVSRSRWAGYKNKLSELSVLPSIDEASINTSFLMFDVRLLEDLVEIYNDYFIDNIDYEFFMEEHSSFEFYSSVDSIEDIDDIQEVSLFFNTRSKDNYIVPSEVLDFLFFEDIDEDFVTQYNYNFLIWGPLEMLYHSLTTNSWTSNRLKTFDNFSISLFFKVFKLFIYFVSLYMLKGYISSKDNGYFILNKWNVNLLYYRSKALRILYSNWFEALPKTFLHYIIYIIYFLVYVIFSLFLYNLAVMLNIFKIISYWFTHNILTFIFGQSFFFFIFIVIF